MPVLIWSVFLLDTKQPLLKRTTKRADSDQTDVASCLLGKLYKPRLMLWFGRLKDKKKNPVKHRKLFAVSSSCGADAEVTQR